MKINEGIFKKALEKAEVKTKIKAYLSYRIFARAVLKKYLKEIEEEGIMDTETGKIYDPEEFEEIKKSLKDKKRELQKYIAIEKSDMTKKEKRLKQVDLKSDTYLARTANAHKNYLKRQRKKRKGKK